MLNPLFIAETDEENRLIGVWYAGTPRRSRPVRPADVSSDVLARADYAGAERGAIIAWLKALGAPAGE